MKQIILLLLLPLLLVSCSEVSVQEHNGCAKFCSSIDMDYASTDSFWDTGTWCKCEILLDSVKNYSRCNL